MTEMFMQTKKLGNFFKSNMRPHKGMVRLTGSAILSSRKPIEYNNYYQKIKFKTKYQPRS